MTAPAVGWGHTGTIGVTATSGRYLKEDSWIIEDSFSGGFNKAEVLYRLIPADYRIEGNSVTAPWGRIDVVGSDFEMSLSEGFESLYYWQKQFIPVLVVRAGKNCGKISTRFILEPEMHVLYFHQYFTTPRTAGDPLL